MNTKISRIENKIKFYKKYTKTISQYPQYERELVEAIKSERFDKIIPINKKIINLANYINSHIKSKDACSICSHYHHDMVYFTLILNNSINLLYETMWHAAARGNLKLFKELSKSKKIHTKYYKKSLVYACQTSQIEIIKLILNTTTITQEDCNEAIEEACLIGNIEIINLFLEIGIKIGNNKNAFLNACKSGNIDLVNKIISFSNKNILINDEILNCACESGNLNLLRHLVNLGLKIDFNADLISHAPISGNIEIIKFLINMGVNVHINSEKTIKNAIKNSLFYVVDYLVENGLDVMNYGHSALILSCENGDFKAIKYLIDKNVNIHVNNEEALLEAISHSHFDIANYLIELGADIHANNNEILKFVCLNCDITIIDYVHKKGVDINSSDGEAVSLVCERDDLELIRYIKSIGANFKKNINKNFLKASSNASFDAINYLIDNEIDLHENADEILKKIFDRDNLDIVEYLYTIKKIPFRFFNHDLLMKYAKDLQGNKVLFMINHGVQYKLSDHPRLLSAIISCCDDPPGKNKFDKSISTKTHRNICTIKNVKNAIKKHFSVHRSLEEGFRTSMAHSKLNITKFYIKLMKNEKLNLDKYLSEAFWWDHHGIIKHLLKNGADIHANNDFLLHEACKKGNLALIKYCLKQGADINPEKTSTIISACDGDQIDIVRYLIKNGAYYHFEYDKDIKPTKYITNNINHLILKYLWHQGIVVGKVCHEIIKLSCRKSNMSLINFLIQKGFNKKNIAIIGLTHALEIKNFKMALKFIKLGADIHLDDDNLFRWASAWGDQEVMDFLLQKGANINAKNGMPLKNACERGDLKKIKYLIKNNADVNISNGAPLLLACMEAKKEAPNPFDVPQSENAKDNFNTVKFLIENGADIHINEEAALFWSISMYVFSESQTGEKLVEYLLKAGADASKIKIKISPLLSEIKNPEIRKFIDKQISNNQSLN